MASSKLGRTSKPYTPEEAAVLYTDNKTFRSLANKVAKMLDSEGYAQGAGNSSNQAGLQVAIAAANSSRAVGNEMKPEKGKGYYPHPALILYWARTLISPKTPLALGQFKQVDASPLTATGSSAIDTDVEMLPDPAVIATLINNFKLPNKASAQWQKIIKRLHIKKMPYWLVSSVQPMRNQSKGVVGGYRLSTITVRIPVGAKKISGQQYGRRKFGPEHFVTIKINLKSTLAQSLFGELWLARSSDDRNIFLAGKRTGSLSFNKFMMLLEDSANSQRAAFPAFGMPIAKEDYGAIGSKRPEGFESKLDTMRNKSLSGSLVGVDARSY